MPQKILGLRLFVESIEWPVISANVNIYPNSPASASIQIVPAESALEIKPRSLVLLFFRDPYSGKSSNLSIVNATESGETYDQLNVAIPFTKDQPVLDNYRLLFAGEIVGIGYEKQPGSRSMVLQCLDFSNYWDTCWYMKGSSMFTSLGGQGAFMDAGSKTLASILFTTGEKIYETLTTLPVGYAFKKVKVDGKWTTLAQIPGLLGGIVHLLQAIGGTLHGGTETKREGVSRFFTLSELRLHLTQQLGVYPDDGPKRLLKKKGFGTIWNRSINGLGKQFNFRMAINALMPYIFYEVYPNPAAKYKAPTGIYDPFAGVAYKMIKDHPLYRVWVDEGLKMAQSISILREKMDAEEYPERSILTTSLSDMAKNCSGWAMDAKENNVPQASACLSKASAALKEARTIASKGVPKKDTANSKQFWNKMYRAENQLRKLTTIASPGYTADVAESEPAFLYNQLFHPDLWFCPPPRCNIIFPDQYTSLSYSRSFLQEITRLMLRTPNTAAYGQYDILFDNYAYAPMVYGVLSGKPIIKKAEGELLRTMRDILPHELYTGVIPHQETSKNFKVFGLKGDIMIEGAYMVGYIQRLTNFLYFKYRYATRTVSITGPFNPFLAAGFPAVVLDKPTDPNKANSLSYEMSKVAGDEFEKSIKIRDLMAGTHYMGQITSLSHTVSQGGGTTVAALSYGRTNKENVDPVGSNINEEVLRKYRKGAKIYKKYKAAAQQLPHKGDRGIYGGEITKAEELKDAKGIYALMGSSRNNRKKFGFSTSVEVNVVKTAKEFGSQVMAEVGSATPETALLSFKCYLISEMISKSEEGDFDFPFEAMVRPAWYGNCWLNEQIGSVYQEFLGVGSIVDPISIGGSLPETGSSTVQINMLADEDGTTGPEGIAIKERATEDGGDEDGTLAKLEGKVSIKDAVSFLEEVYTLAQYREADMDEFIHSYVWRPIATMTEILGSSDLEYDVDEGSTENPNKNYGKVKQGVEGFFSRSCGDYKDIFLLVDESVSSILKINRGDARAEDLDVRKDRWLASMAYVLEIADKGMRG